VRVWSTERLPRGLRTGGRSTKRHTERASTAA
jgi:hypothetical protein